MSTVLSRLSAIVLSFYRDTDNRRQQQSSPVIEVGNALKADIERSGLKYREVPATEVGSIRSPRRWLNSTEIQYVPQAWHA
jgi:hypothetical protein